MKICSKCGIKKSIREFHRNRNHGDGYRPECRIHRHVPERNRLVVVRKEVVSKLGYKCASLDCRWLNLDDTLGCTDVNLLHIDHKLGKGNKERKATSVSSFYRRLLALPEDTLLRKYQLLCPNYNWLKRLKESA
jgi:hypothetical protein